MNDLIRNFNFGELLANLKKERDSEKRRWVDKLVNIGGAKPAGDGPQEQEINLGPIQTVFSLNLKESLLAY